MGKRSRHVKKEIAEAMGTPDELDYTVNLLEDGSMDRLARWVIDFQKKMRIKHGESVEIDYYTEQREPYALEKLTAVIKATPRVAADANS